MILNRKDLKEYLLADKKQLGITRNFPDHLQMKSGNMK